MKKPLLYLHTPSFGRQQGGVGNSCFRILEHLSELFEIKVFIPKLDLPDFTYETHNLEQEEATLDCIYYASGGNTAYKNQFLNDILITHAKKDAPIAIINFFIGPWTLPVTQSALFLKIPYLNFCRGNDIDLGLFQEQRHDLIYSLRHAKRNFCVSSEMEKKILALVPHAKTEFIANSIEHQDFKGQHFPIKEWSELKFALIGHIKRKKGLEILLDKIDYQNGEKLFIMGDLYPPQAKFLHGFLTLNQRWSSSISHLPFEKNKKHFFEQMRNIDIVCIPSLHDGMPNVLLEALALGKIVIASNIGGNSDVILNGENGFLFDPMDEDNFISVLNKVRSLSLAELDLIQKNAIDTIHSHYRIKFEKKRYHKIFNSIFKTAVKPVEISDHYTVPK